jgi:hypothetical protein
MEKDLFSFIIQVVVVNGATNNLMVMGGVMWGSPCWSVSQNSMFET